ncbi:MAG TPA: putative zinc-binding peptidase [Devosia sp.]
MKLFRCDHCGHALYFENVVCEHCGHRLGYEPESNALVSLEADDHNGTWHAPHLPGVRFAFCANAEFGACNWLVDAASGDRYCRACRHNEIIPPMEDAQSLIRWQVIERAKKRLIYSLLRLRLPLATRSQDSVHGLSFRFLNEALSPAPVMTGHLGGVITIPLAEADDAQREYRRTQFNEPYRTLLGHFRHEVGHHYWDILVENGSAIPEFRELFGDERQPYEECLQRYYATGAPLDWQARYISGYATCHPWEDFAESWAHYLHLVDTTEMASAFGVRMRPALDAKGELTAKIDFDPYRIEGIHELIENWVPLASLINNLNRAVGQHDAYPFVLTPVVIEKLGFIHRLVRSAGSVQWTVPGPGAPIPINRPAA